MIHWLIKKGGMYAAYKLKLKVKMFVNLSLEKY